MKKNLRILALAAALCLSLCACGGDASAPESPAPAETTPAVPETTTPVESEAPEVSATPVELGGSIETENFKMTFNSLELVPEYSYTTGEYSSSSIYVEEGYQLLMVRGTFENLGTTVIGDTSFHFTVTVNDEYTVDGYDVSLNFERSKYFEIDPYTEQNYVLSINIPDKLAEMFETASFTVAFKDDMSVPTTTYHSDGTETVDVDQQYIFTSGLGSAG